MIEKEAARSLVPPVRRLQFSRLVALGLGLSVSFSAFPALALASAQDCSTAGPSQLANPAAGQVAQEFSGQSAVLEQLSEEGSNSRNGVSQDPDLLLSLLSPSAGGAGPGEPGVGAGGTERASALLEASQPVTPVTDGHPGDSTKQAFQTVVHCQIIFDLETGNSGDTNVRARGGDSGDAIGGDARGGDSLSIGVAGSVALGGNGGAGGSAGGSGPYAGAVIGDHSSGGGGNGGNGGAATCIAGNVGRDGKACSGGDVFNFSGGGGDATGGKAKSGDGGAAQAGDNRSGGTGDGTVALDPLVQISLEP